MLTAKDSEQRFAGPFTNDEKKNQVPVSNSRNTSKVTTLKALRTPCTLPTLRRAYTRPV